MSTITPNASELATKLALHNRWRRGDDDVDSPRCAELGFVIDDAVSLLRTQAARIAEFEAALAQQVPEPTFKFKCGDCCEPLADLFAPCPSCGLGTEDADPAPVAQQVPEPRAASAVYLVATGHAPDGRELYERHDAPVPMCDWEVLYTAPVAQQVPAVPGWQPIETAPKDGSLFLCWVAAERWSAADGEGSGRGHDVSQVDFCNWRTQADIPDCGWFDPCCGQIGDSQGVTHWMPLPAAPLLAPTDNTESA